MTETTRIIPMGEDDPFRQYGNCYIVAVNENPLQVPQTATDGVAAIFGKWPGNETEEELLAALKRHRDAKEARR